MCETGKRKLGDSQHPPLFSQALKRWQGSEHHLVAWFEGWSHWVGTQWVLLECSGCGVGQSSGRLLSALLCHAEFSRRWCTLQDGVLSYYENDRNTVPNGEIRVEEIVCLVNNPLHAHG